jgi:hypothetical protein
MTISSGNTITYNSAHANNAAYYVSNPATASAGQTGGVIWQSGATFSGDNTLCLYKLDATTNTLSQVGSAANPAAAGSDVLSIRALDGR